MCVGQLQIIVSLFFPEQIKSYQSVSHKICDDVVSLMTHSVLFLDHHPRLGDYDSAPTSSSSSSSNENILYYFWVIISELGDYDSAPTSSIISSNKQVMIQTTTTSTTHIAGHHPTLGDDNDQAPPKHAQIKTTCIYRDSTANLVVKRFPNQTIFFL